MSGRAVFNLFNAFERQKGGPESIKEGGDVTGFHLKALLVVYLVVVSTALACIFSLGT
jgi:hypothetical protein